MPTESIDDARAFVDKAAKDKDLREEGIRRWHEIVKVGQEHGFHFTLDHFKQAEREKVGNPAHGGDPGQDPDTCFCLLL